MKTLVLLSCLLGADPLQAQQPAGSDQASVAFRQMEIFSRTVQEARADAVRHTTERRAEQLARAEFWAKANRFISLWTDFASRLNENQTVDVKLARRLSKAFHELETSNGWPVRVEPVNATATEGK